MSRRSGAAAKADPPVPGPFSIVTATGTGRDTLLNTGDRRCASSASSRSLSAGAFEVTFMATRIV